MLTTATKNLIADYFAGLVTHLSLHTGFPSTSGASEVAGGSYARKASGWAAGANSKVAIAAPLVFDVPALAGAKIKWIGNWSALTAGTYRGCQPVGGAPFEFTVDLVNNKLLAEGHPLQNDDLCVLFGGTPPTGTGISEGGELYVVNRTAGDWQLSTTLGGAAIDITAVGDTDVLASKIVPVGFEVAGQLTLSSFEQELFP